MDEQSLAEMQAEMQARLQQWRREHPRASFDEIEEAVQAEVMRWQAQLVEDVIQAGAAAAGGEAAPVCASCGARMQRNGRRRREVLSRLGQAIQLERDYYVCPACGAGLFPPG